MENKDFYPKILAITCNWCSYAGADLAGTSRLEYDVNVRIVKVPCTGRIDYALIIKGFEQGADGIIVSGCHPGDCHYSDGNYHARRRWIIFRDLLQLIGINPKRIHFSWVSAAEGKKWAELVKEVTATIKELGPFTEYQSLKRECA